MNVKSLFSGEKNNKNILSVCRLFNLLSSADAYGRLKHLLLHSPIHFIHSDVFIRTANSTPHPGYASVLSYLKGS